MKAPHLNQLRSLGRFASSLAALIICGTITAVFFYVRTFAASEPLFKQDFSSSTIVADYVSATPTNGQFNAIGTSGAGTTISINSGALQFTRTANVGSFSRTTDFSPIPTAMLYKVDISVSGNSVAQTNAATFQLGSGFGTANNTETNASTYARFGVNFTATDGTYQIRDISTLTNSGDVSGTNTITWAINNSGATLTYVAPDGNQESVANDTADIWIGSTRSFNDLAVLTAAQSISDLKFAFTAGAGTIRLDNIQIEPLSGLFYRSAQSGNWNSASTWESSTDNAIFYPALNPPTSAAGTSAILSGHTVTVTSAVNADQLTVNSGGTLVVDSGVTLTVDDGTGLDLTVDGTLTNSGTLSLSSANVNIGGSFASSTGTVTPGTSTVNFNGSGAQSVAAVSYHNLQFSNAGTKSFLNGTTRIKGILTFSGSATGDAISNSSTIEFNGTTPTILGTFSPYYNLHLNNPAGISTLTAITVNDTVRVKQGTFTSGSDYHHVLIDAAGTLSLSANITVSGNWTNNGTFIANGNTVTFDGAVNQFIGGSSITPFATLTVSNTGTSPNNVVSLSQHTSDTALTLNIGVFDQGTSFNLTSGAVTVNPGATWRNLGTGEVTLSDTVTNNGTINLNANGQTCGDPDDISISSSQPGQRTWSGGGTFTLVDVEVQGQGGLTAITVRNGTNSGNNSPAWVFVSDCLGLGQTYTWQPVAASTDWQVGANWNPDRAVNNVEDVMVFDFDETNSAIVTNVPTQTIAALRLVDGVTVTMSSNAANTLTISGGAANAFTIPSSNSLTVQGTNALKIALTSGSSGSVNGNMSFTNGAHQLTVVGGGNITFSGTALFSTTSSYEANTHPFGTGTSGNGSSNSIIFDSNATYSHGAGGSPFGSVGAGPVVVFTPGSGATAKILNATNFQASGRAYANLTIGDGSSAVNVSDTGSGNFEFYNLTINSTLTNNSSLSYGGSGSSVVTIKGNITSNGHGPGPDVIGGTAPDVFLTAGDEIVIDSGGPITFGNDGTNARAILFSSDATLNSGTTLNLARVVQMGLGAAGILTDSGTIVPNSSTPGYVVGAIMRASIVGSYIFAVGLAPPTPATSGYTPVELSNAIGGGTLTVRAVDAPTSHPSVIDAASLDEYWTLTLNTGSLTTDLKFTYLEADVDGTEANYRAIRISGPTIVNLPTTMNTLDNTASVSNIGTFSDWTLGEPVGPTAVKLKHFSAESFPDGVQLSWESGFEVDNLGYHVYREQNGTRTRVTPSLIAGSALTVGQGNQMTAGYSYSWFDPDGTPETAYHLEAIDLNGSRQWAGPLAPAASRRQVSPRRGQAKLLNELTSTSRNAAATVTASWPAAMTSPAADLIVSTEALVTSQAIAAGQAVKIQVRQDGWYRVTQPELVAAGFDPAVDARMLQLIVDGQEVPIHLSTEGAVLGDHDSLEFYGVALDTPTTDTRTYWLISGTTAGQRMLVRRGKVKPVDKKAEPGLRDFNMTTERRENSIYFSSLLNGEQDNFFGRPVLADPVTQELVVTGLALDSAAKPELEVALQGLTNVGHQVEIRINGTHLGAVTFTGREHRAAKFSVNLGLLREGNNTVTLNSSGGSADVSLIDFVRLTYPHRYRAFNNSLRFTAPGGQVVSLTGFTNPKVRVIDITNPNSPTQLSANVTPADGGYTVKVQSRGTDVRTMIAFTDELSGHPGAITPNQPSNWSAATNNADMVIITHRDFREAVEPLANLRRSQGLNLAIVDVEDVYDEFSYGAHTPLAVKNFLNSAAGNWSRAPQFVLLVGDSTWDPRDYLKKGTNDFVPTKLIDTQFMETGSDDWLADFSGAGLPAMAIGRLPARTVAEINLMVSKIMSYEQERELNAPLRGAVMVADSGFEQQSAEASALLPAGITVQSINRSQVGNDDLMRGQVVDALNQGPMIVNYFGHGSVTVWTGAGLLDSTLASGLTNANAPSIYVMMTCLNGYATDANIDSLGEAVLKAPNGGGVAVWASSGFTEPMAQFVLDREFYRLLFNGQPIRLGEAARGAKTVVSDLDVRRTWVLLGDPAMRIR